MIVFSCPNCDTEIEVPDNKAGARATCGECGERLQVPGAVKKASAITSKRPTAKAAPPSETPPPASRKAPKLTKRRDEDEDDEDEEDKKPAKPSKKTPPVTKRRRRDDDGDEEDEKPDRPKKKSPKQSSGMVLWIVLALLLLGGGGAGAYFLFFNKSDKPTPPRESANKDGTPDPNKDRTQDPNKDRQVDPNKDKPAGDGKVVGDGGKTEEEPNRAPVVATKDEIYKHVIKSTAWVINNQGNGSMAMGSGSLIDKQNKLVLTNYHVVHGEQGMVVIFPAYDKDKHLIRGKDIYMKQVESHNADVIQAKVLASSKAQDLALLQLIRVPDNIEALPIGNKSVDTNDEILSVGNPGPSTFLWVPTSGTVRGVGPKKWKILLDNTPVEMNATVVETDSQTYHGDSGGPLVNKKAELIGVTEGGTKEGVYAIFIDLSEVRKFIEKTCQDNKLTFVPANRPLVVRRKANVQQLVRKLSSQDAGVRGRAVQDLGEMGIDARVAVPDLMKVLKDTDGLDRRFAQKALRSIGAPDKNDVPVLREALKDTDLSVRTYAAEALGWIGQEARSAGPDLLALLKKKDPDATVRQNAARSLGQIRYDDRREVLAVLTAALDDTDRGVRVAAAEALTKAVPLGASDVDRLTKLLAHKDDAARAIAARALGQLGRRARKAIPDLLKAIKDDPAREVRRAAILALVPFGTDARDAVKLLIDVMNNEEDLRPAAVQVFATLGAEAAPAVKELGKALFDDNPNTRNDSLRALRRLGPAAEDAAADLARLVKDENHDQRLQVLDILAAIGPGAEEAISELIPILGEEDAVALPGPRGTKIIAIVQKDPVVFDRVVATLARIGKPAVKPLGQALYDMNQYIRLGAVTALGNIGRDARPVKNLVAAVAQNRQEKKEIQTAALKAYNQIISGTAPKRKPKNPPPKDKAPTTPKK